MSGKTLPCFSCSIVKAHWATEGQEGQDQPYTLHGNKSSPFYGTCLGYRGPICVQTSSELTRGKSQGSQRKWSALQPLVLFHARISINAHDRAKEPRGDDLCRDKVNSCNNLRTLKY